MNFDASCLGSNFMIIPAFIRSLRSFVSAHALRHDFLQVFHIFWGSTVMLHVGAFARDVSRKEGLALENAVQNFSHPESEAVGLGEAGDFRFAIASAQNRGELTESVNALVIHLDGDDALELLENFLEPVRQRMKMAQMYRADFFALVAAPVSTASWIGP